jgi:metal-responsive CopG/Arc/MetJ family transcriptional regulator
MANDVYSVRLTDGMASEVDTFARELGLSRSAALMMLVNFGLQQSRSKVVRAAVAGRHR